MEIVLFCLCPPLRVLISPAQQRQRLLIKNIRKPPENKKILSRQYKIAGTGAFRPAVPPGLTRSRAHSQRTNIRLRLFTERLSPSHILRSSASFPLALRSPFSSVRFCRNSTACGSLKEGYRAYSLFFNGLSHCSTAHPPCQAFLCSVLHNTLPSGAYCA